MLYYVLTHLEEDVPLPITIFLVAVRRKYLSVVAFVL
jgi:hypothetical protein